MLNKTSATVTAPKPGEKEKTVVLKISTPKKKSDQPALNWSMIGEPTGIRVDTTGKVYVNNNASAGSYLVKAEDPTGVMSSVFCEIIVK